MARVLKFAAACLAIAAGGALLTSAAMAGVPGDVESSPTHVLNKRTYLWLLPRFWMKGTESYAYFRIDNPTDRAITVYMHCASGQETIPEMTGRHTIRPRGTKVVDSRKPGKAAGGVLVRCSLKSHSLAEVRYLIRDSRVKNFGNELKFIRPEIS